MTIWQYVGVYVCALVLILGVLLVARRREYTLPLPIPPTIAKCPICGAALVIAEIDEWETETGRATEGGIHIECPTEPEMDSDDWEDWFRGHYSTPYIDWLPVCDVVFRWFDGRYRVRTDSHGPTRVVRKAEQDG